MTFEGFVLGGARTASSNSPADSNVPRFVGPLPFGYPSGQAALIESAADQYRVTTSVWDAQEYLVWAANTGSFSTLEDPAWASSAATTIPDRGLTVNDPSSNTGTRADGSGVVLIRGATAIGGVTLVAFRRGGTVTDVTFTVGVDIVLNADSRTLTLVDTATVRTAANVPVGSPPAMSTIRGDTVTVSYYAQSPRFWWTRNDTRTRFAWVGSTQRWEPLKGGGASNLGKLEPGERYTIEVVGDVGSYLPGTTVSGATLRLGSVPDESSYPVVFRESGSHSGVLIVSDGDATADFNFNATTPPLAGVVGVGTGSVVWNPTFLAIYTGLTVWYSRGTFGGDGVVGPYGTDPLFLSPIPQYDEYPILRVGNRSPLRAVMVADEAALSVLTVTSGSVGVARTTGKLKLNAADVSRSNPGTHDSPNSSFDPLYLGAQVIYAGVTLNRRAQPMRAPVTLVGDGGTPVVAGTGVSLYIPDGVLFPGVSGIVNVPDGSGRVPGAGTVGPRPGVTGLVRRLTAGTGDTILFGIGGRATKLVAVDFEDQLPTNPYTIPQGTVYVSMEKHGALGSKVVFGADVADSLNGGLVYFSQCDFAPSVYPGGIEVVGTHEGPFTLGGAEVLSFILGATTVTWSASALGAGTYAATAVAASLTTAIGGASGSCVVVDNRLVLRGSTHVAIGFGTGGVVDLSGCRALGFIPGSYAIVEGSFGASDPNWSPCGGPTFGFHCADRTPDVQSTTSVENATLVSSIQPVPYVFLDNVPREDLPGYDLGIYFRIDGGTTLRPYDQLTYLFPTRRIGWLSRGSFGGRVTEPLRSINLQGAGVVPETLYDATGGYLKVALEGGPYTYLNQGVDYLLDSGSADIINRVGDVTLTGDRGSYDLGPTFTDLTVTFAGQVVAGDLLGIQGMYRTVTAVGATTLTVTPPFVEGDGGNYVAWEVRSGVASGQVDPSILADVVYRPFRHLTTEPFVVNVLHPIGVSGGALVALGALPDGVDFYGRIGSDPDLGIVDIPLTRLSSQSLGLVANGSLSIPMGTYLETGSFSIVVGARVFTHGTDLIPVATFSSNPGNNVEYIQMGPGVGSLKFGDTVLEEFEGSEVFYREGLLPPSILTTGTGQINPSTGQVSLSQVDLTARVGAVVYVVQAIQPGRDGDVNPILGAFSFRQPVPEGRLVEAIYTRAVPDTGVKLLVNGLSVVVREILPSFIRREVAFRISDQVYGFNSSDRILDPTVAPRVYAGARQTSYGVPAGSTVNFGDSTISFVDPVPVGTVVTISYAVVTTLGGETTYTVSQPPVWRPPLYLNRNQSLLTLSGDRTTELFKGQMLRLGGFTAYLKTVSYDGTNTLVTIYPAPLGGAGSMAPGENSSGLVTDRAITPSVDGVAITNVDAGFLATFPTAYGVGSVPRFNPLPVGSTSLVMDGDYTRYGQSGHVLEAFGVPYLLTGSSLASDGRTTTFNLASPVVRSGVWSSGMSTSLLRISTRPIYQENEMVVQGPGDVVPTEPVTVVRFEGGMPGITLTEGRDYLVDTETGNLTLTVGPKANGSLRFFRTDRVFLRPQIVDGVTLYPRVAAAFGTLSLPGSNLGRTLVGTYTYDSPDSFYTGVETLSTYVGDVSESIVSGTTMAPEGNDRGSQSIGSERVYLVNRDRVARVFLACYNGLSTSFEQVLETIDGNPIGDGDGKFRFHVGHGTQWVPPGHEDAITGGLNPRNLWFEVWGGLRVGETTVRLTPTDPVISPIGVTIDGNGRPSGTFQDPASFNIVREMQRDGIQNDVDDVVLVTRDRVTRSLSGFITYRVTGYGVYLPLSNPSPFSRIFPERTGVFTTLSPGIDGEYTAGKLSLNPFAAPPSIDFLSTNGQSIGKLENPVLGVVTNVMGTQLRDRLARARVWGYSAAGYPGIDAGTANRPTVLLSQVPFDQFPVENGLPDTSLLASQSLGPIPTGVPDITTGEPTLHIPPFQAGDALAIGLPDGSIKALGYTGTILTVDGVDRYGGVYVASVYKGVAVTFKGKTSGGADIPITNPSTLVVLTGNATGVPYDPSRGDTLLVVPDSGSSPTVSDPPTAAEMATLLTALPGYRIGTDVGISQKTGDIVDITLPSFTDPTFFGLKEITGQRPPPPMGTVEGVVAFQSGRIEPLEVPALRGESLMDNGDYRLPYTRLDPSEIELLGELNGPGDTLIYDDSTDPPPAAPANVDAYAIEALYPDEIGDNDAVIDPLDPANPGALITAVDLQPSATVYPAPGHQGVGTLKPYDVVLVEPDVTLAPGSSGIITVGNVTHGTPSIIEPPRFVSSTLQATEMDLSVDNLQTWFGGGVNGVVVTEDANAPGLVITIFDFESTPPASFVLDNGTGGGSLPTPVGGYNDFMTACQPGTTTTVRLVRSDGHFQANAAVVLTNTVTGANILASTFSVSGDGGATSIPVVASGLKFHPQVIEVRTATPFFNFAPFNPTNPSPGITRTGGFHDAALSVQGVGSTVCGIAADRLTVTLPMDVKTALPRGTLTSGSDPVECALTITSHTAAFFNPTGAVYVTGDVDVNSNTRTNGGLPFTFLPRSGLSPSVHGVGRFFAGAGSLKVMAWEAHENLTVTASDITFKAMPTARQDDDSPIFNGTVICDEAFDPPVVSPRLNRFTPFTIAAGGESNILPGDLLVIRSRLDGASVLPSSSGKAGTYLVRAVIGVTHVVEEHRVTLTNNTGDQGWLGFEFPTVVSISTSGPINLTISSNPDLPAATTFAGVPVSATKAFGSTGRVFLIVRPELLNSTVSGVYATAVYSANYASLSGAGGNTFVNLTDFRDGLGNVVSSGTFTALATAGVLVSGMTVTPVVAESEGLPPNYPGYTNATAAPGSRSFFGFRSVVASRGATSVTLEATTNGNLETAGTLLSVYTKIKMSSGTLTAEDAPIYDQIPGIVDFASFAWDDIHTVGAFVPAGTRCFLPGDRWVLNYVGAAGIYVEPSFPRTGNNLGQAGVNVVDATHSLLDSQVGARSVSGYLDASIVPPGGSLLEIAQAEVRRPRRWGNLNGAIGTSFEDLRYVYEIRRGIAASVTTVSGVCTLTAEPVDRGYRPEPIGGGTATQLGDFTSSRVNVHPGDVVRFLSATGVVVASCDVLLVSNQSLGLVACEIPITPGTRFEVLLRTPPVPHEQSVNELADLATGEEILNRRCNYTTQSGGRVVYTTNVDPQVAYDQSVNKLSDTDPTVSYAGVVEGDIVLIDPAGTLAGSTGVANPPERGEPPSGDNGVPSRGADYTVGGPRRRDDNRGFYRVASVVGPTINVTAQGNDLAGDRTNPDVVLGTASVAYAIYPTIHGSSLSGVGNGLEGQMDLRPTAFADPTNSYNGTWMSVAPFSYRVIRPSSRLTDETINLIFSMRERILSWMDVLRDVSEISHGGTYRTFQVEQHISHLGSLPDFDEGWGVMSNGLITSIFGRTLVAPYANNTSCLSVLDRRFWILDTQLDIDHPPYGSTTPYADFEANVGRPVLPDRITVALDQRDRIRATRNAWLALRTHMVQGTLEAIRRFDASIPGRLRSVERQRLASRSTR